MPVVVGRDGLIIECTAETQWSDTGLSTHDEFRVVDCNSDGDVVAAGVDGALALRKDGIWQLMDHPAETTWNDVRANGREMWLAGDDGNLARGLPGEAWELINYPDSTSLHSVCAFEDSVYVGGTQGSLKVLVDGQWHDVPTPWEGSPYYTRSLVRLDDGRLVAFSNTLWVREADGWVSLESYGYNLIGHLKVHDGFLWLISGYASGRRVDPSTDPWQSENYRGFGYNRSMAPGPDGRVLVVADDGVLTWLVPDAEENLIRYPDPAGHLNFGSMRRFSDGELVFPVDENLFKITTDGIERVTFLNPEVNALFNNSSMLAGVSLEDFYLLSSGTFRRIQGGEVVLETEVPDEYGNSRHLLVNDVGEVCLSLNTGIFFWTNNQWEVWDEGRQNRIYLTGQQNFVATFVTNGLYFSGGESVSFELPMTAILAWETEVGVLEFMNSNFAYARWEEGIVSGDLIYMDPLPGCFNIYYRCVLDTTEGVLVASGNHSMVFRVPDDPLRANWDLVAGPCLHQISQMQVLEDGSLVVFTSYDDNIMTHPTSGF